MPNIFINPNSGMMEFSTGIAGGNTFNTNFTGGASAVRFGYDNVGGLNITNYSTGVSGIDRFSVDGVNGRLFSVTDNLSGSLFSVNDIAGLPIIEAFDDNTVIMGAFNRNDFVLTGSSLGLGGLPNTGTTKLHVSGNMLLSGTLTTNQRPFVNGTGVLLSGEAAQVDLSTTVRTTGDQSIDGLKTFSSNAFFEKDVNVTQNLRVSGNSFFTGNLSVTGNLTIGGNVNNPNLVLTKNNQTISGTKTFDVAPIFNGNPLITVADLSSYAPSSEVVYTTGVQSIAGLKTFSSNSFFTNDVNVTQNLRVSGNSFFTGDLSVTGNFTVGGNVNNPNLVLTKGKQTISGDKTFVDKININAYTGNGYDITNHEFALNIGGNPNDNAGILVDAYGVNPPQILMRRARGTPTGLSGVLKDDVLFNLQARGYVSGLNDYSTNSRAAIRLIAAEDWVGTAGYTGQGTNILFRTTNIGTGLAMDKVIIGTSGINLLDGNIYISGNPVSTGSNLDTQSLNLTGLVVSGLGTPFILKSASNTNSVYFDPVEAGLQGVLYANRIISNSIFGPTSDSDLSIIYNTINTTKVLKFQTPDGGFGVLNRAILDSNGNFGIGSGISSVPSRFYVSGNSILQGDVIVSGTLTTNQRPFVNGTGVLLSGEAAQVDLSTTIRTTGNQTVSGIKDFQSAPLVSGKEVYYQKNIVYFTGNNFTPDYISGRNFVYQLTGFATVYNNLNNPINMPEGEAVLVKVVQSNFGNNYMIFGSDYRFPASASPTLTQPSGRVDIFNILKLDNKFYTTYVKDFAN